MAKEDTKNGKKEDKLQALDHAISQIEKQYGKGAVMKLGDSGVNMNVETCLLYTSSHPTVHLLLLI